MIITPEYIKRITIEHDPLMIKLKEITKTLEEDLVQTKKRIEKLKERKNDYE